MSTFHDLRQRGQPPHQMASSFGTRTTFRSPLWCGGQAMILAVMALGGAILGATTIAGFLMVYQIRQTTDLANSAKAIFAADAGVECALYNQFISSDCAESNTLTNGASYAVDCVNGSGATVACDSGSAEVLFSRGTAATARRAFSAQLATTTFP